MLPNKPLLRFARRLQDVWHQADVLARHDTDDLMVQLDRHQQALHRARRRFATARQNHLSLIQPDLSQEIVARTRALRQACGQLENALARPASAVPSMRSFVDQLLED
jgi:hypothetical protein